MKFDSPHAKFIAVHAGARDSYQLPIALHEGSMLDCFVTDGYQTPDVVGSFIRKFDGRGARISDRLKGALVINDPVPLMIGCIEHAALRFGWKWERLAQIKAKQLSLRALQKAEDSGAGIFATSYFAAPAFRQSTSRGLTKLLFQIHPDPRELRLLFRAEIERNKVSGGNIAEELEMQLSAQELSELGSEAELADGVLVASSFTRNTLIAQGVDAEKIVVCPYGVDQQFLDIQLPIRQINGPLRLAFVGSVIQRKGVGYLLEALSRFPEGTVELHIYTRWIGGEWKHSLGQTAKIQLHLNLSTSQMIESLRMKEMFIMPSIAEGYGLVLGQAMALGIPCITTSNSMGADVIVHGANGLLVPVGSADAIEEQIAWALDHRSELGQMGERAAITMKEFTWDRFREGVRSFAGRFSH